MKVIILNGPPGCGKDTIANMLCKVAPVLRGEFKGQLYLQTAMLLTEISDDFGGPEISEVEVKERNEDRALKEQPWIGGLSVRRWLQITSEMVVKKDKGSDFFGRAAADLWYGKYIHHVISDGGFIEEVNAVVDKFGQDTVYVVRLFRNGFDFGTDSRRYIYGSAATELDFYLEEDNPLPAVQFLQELLTD
jgi:Fe-S cluster assembly ATPase SufC